MPAKKRSEPHFKPFIGRVFTLRQHKNIPCYKDNKEHVKITLSDFGQAVLVIDENNTRVKITLVNGTFVWIPKFFLHKEIKGASFKKIDGIAECIQILLFLAEDMRSKEQDFNSFTDYAEELERAAICLRQYADEISPTNKKRK